MGMYNLCASGWCDGAGRQKTFYSDIKDGPWHDFFTVCFLCFFGRVGT
jgi:hypothetical protein